MLYETYSTSVRYDAYISALILLKMCYLCLCLPNKSGFLFTQLQNSVVAYFNFEHYLLEVVLLAKMAVLYLAISGSVKALTK